MINRSVAGACPVAGVILTMVQENHPVAVVACPVARVMQNCVAQVTSKSTVLGSLVDCPFACRIVADLSLKSGVMHSLAGIMDRKADCVQSMACLFTIHDLMQYENFSTTHASGCVHFHVQAST